MREATLRQAERELSNLTRMRYQELIDDSDFTKERTLLKDQITKLQAELNEYVDNSSQWNELTKKAFIFAAYAKENFAKGSIEVKRSIAASFGSNYGICDKKLMFEAPFWLVPIQKEYGVLYAEYKRLELEKMLDTKAWNALLQPMILVWCTLAEEVRTGFMKRNDATYYITAIQQKE